MDTTLFLAALALIANLALGLMLMKHILFKRELIKLKEDMRNHINEHGYDETLWSIFDKRTGHMLRFWR